MTLIARLGSLLILCAGPAALAQEPPRPPERALPGEVDLRPKFEKGQEVRFKLEMVSSTRQGGAGKPPAAPTRRPARPPARSPGTRQPAPEAEEGGDSGPSSSTVTMGLRLKVVDVSAESGATVDLVIDTLKAKISAPGLTTEFDSAKPAKDGDIAGAIFKSIAGQTMTLTVDRAGNITSVKGGEGLAALGQLAGGAAGGKPGDLFSSIFSPKKTSGKARVGESWENTDTIESPLMGRFRMVTRHTLTSHRGGEASIDLRGRLEPSSESGGDEPFTIKGSRHDGRYLWDTRAGMLRRMESTMSTEIEAKLGEQPTLSRSESKLTITRER
ncbi:MAG: DUF6263 family protein [Phycisphaerales bacterium]